MELAERLAAVPEAEQGEEQEQGLVRNLIGQLTELSQSVLAAYDSEVSKLQQELKATKARAAGLRSVGAHKKRSLGTKAGRLKGLVGEPPQTATRPSAEDKGSRGSVFGSIGDAQLVGSSVVAENQALTPVRPSDPEGGALAHGQDAEQANATQRNSIGTVVQASSTDMVHTSNTDINRRFSVPLPGDDRRLRVEIISACGLRDADWMLGAGLSDPYCTCSVVGNTEHTIKTPVKNNTLNPVWNYSCVLLDFEPGDILEFKVFDKDFGKKDDLLGTATLSYSEIPDSGFYGALPLIEDDRSGSYRNPELKISLTWEKDVHAAVKDLRSKALEKWRDCNAQMYLTKPPPLETGIYKTSVLKTRGHKSGKLQHALRTSCLQRMVVQPSAYRRLVWDIVAVMTLTYEAMTLPVINAFEVPVSTAVMVIGVVITCYWTIDCFSSFFVGYHRDGVLQMDIWLVGRRYLKSWFLLDVVILLIDWTYNLIWLANIVSDDSKPGMLRMLKFSRSIRAFRLASLSRAFKVARSVENMIECSVREFSETLFTLLEALVVVLLSTHFIGCAWYFVGRETDDDLTWVKENDLGNRTFVYKYATSYHWALTQFTPASMEVFPENEWERVFTVVIDVVGLVAFSTFVSKITTSMTQLRSLNKVRAAQLKALRRFFLTNGVSLEVRSQITYWVRMNFRKADMIPFTSMESVDALKGLPKTFAVQLQLEVFMPILSHHPFMNEVSFVDSECITGLCYSAVTDQALLKGGKLFSHGEAAEHMYFVASGEMSYHISGKSVLLYRGEWISEACLWIEGWFHLGDFSAITRSDLVGIVPEAFHAVMSSTTAKSNVLRRLVPKYACRFIRDLCEYDIDEIFRCTDLWGNAEHLTDILRRCTLSRY